jgi:hypothetical protein
MVIGNIGPHLFTSNPTHAVKRGRYGNLGYSGVLGIKQNKHLCNGQTAINNLKSANYL